MAIVIISHLEPHPSQMPLPGASTLRQTLQAIGAPQVAVHIEYSLDPAGDVAFADGSFVRHFDEVISVGGTNVAQHLEFINLTGAPVGQFEVDQLIIDPNGDQTSDDCRIDVA